MNKFIFDVDGTLTPSRQKIDKEFANWFEHFATHNAVYLVTGSDRDKTIEQVGQQIYNLAVRVYNCSGSDVYEQNKNVYSSEWALPELAFGWLNEQLDASDFPLRTGKHIETRPGMINFSVVGRNATLGERQLYVRWDEKFKERSQIAHKFNLLFPECLATVGGETGIDIGPIGGNKSQILRDFDENDKLHFFGDAIFPGGNDMPLAEAIVKQSNGAFYKVLDWKDTWEILNENFTNR